MKKYRVAIILSLTFLLLLGAVDCALALDVNVLPAEISPGDAFVVRVEGSDGVTPEAVLAGRPLVFTGCGRGCFETIDAMALAARPGSYPITVKVGQTELEVALTVKKTHFPTVNLTLPEREVILGPGDLERAKKEEKVLESIWKKETPRLWLGKFVLPLSTEISTGFGLRRIMNKERISVHKGIDMRAREGEKIVACNRGRVVLARNLFFGGNTVVIDHGTGIYSIYMHLLKFEVRPGEMVSKGQTVGLAGATGRATGPHLHFSVKLLDISVNPLSLTRLPL